MTPLTKEQRGDELEWVDGIGGAAMSTIARERFRQMIFSHDIVEQERDELLERLRTAESTIKLFGAYVDVPDFIAIWQQAKKDNNDLAERLRRAEEALHVPQEILDRTERRAERQASIE